MESTLPDYTFARDLIAAAPGAILVWSTSAEIVFANPRAESMFGYGRGELLGRALSLVLKQIAESAPRQSIEHVRRMVRQLSRMAGDLMDLSRLEAGRLELVREPVDVADLARASVARQPASDGRPIDVVVRGQVPTCSADPDRVAQVMDNLLTNAVKYGSPNTPIVVEVAPADGGVSVAVTNEGPGIAAEDLPRLFGRFERAERRGAVKGVGLGLYIARGLVEAHGGAHRRREPPGADDVRVRPALRVVRGRMRSQALAHLMSADAAPRLTVSAGPRLESGKSCRRWIASRL